MMFKKLGLKVLIDFIWKNSNLRIDYNKTASEITIKFKVDDEDFELLKHGILNKLQKEINVVTDDS